MSSYADILKKKSKEWDCPDMMDATKRAIAKIPFSSPQLNYATYGGIPRNCLTEFCGDPGGGKSSTAIDLCRNAIQVFREEHEVEVAKLRSLVGDKKKEYAGPLEDLIERGPKKILYVDLEHSFDYTWAEKMGVHEGDIDVMQPPNIPGEDILQTVQELVQTGELGLLVLDSVPSLVTKAELEKKYGEKTVAPLAGLMTLFCRKLVPLMTRHETTVLFINQTRPDMENPYAIKTPGGEAIKFYSMLRCFFRQGAPVDFVGNELPKSAEDPAGYLINVKLIKQKSAANDRKQASYYLMAQSGIRPDFDYAKLAINKYDIIKKNGGWFTFCDPFTGEILTEEDGKPKKVNGQVKVYDYLQSHPDYYAQLRKFITADIEGRSPEEVLSETALVGGETNE